MPDIPPLPDGLPTGHVRPIVIHPDPRLREVAQPAGFMDTITLHQLAADMLATMYHAQGRGLAGPQIGVMRRIFVMDATWKEGSPDPVVVLDPDFLWLSTETATAEEGCLSIPDQPVAVRRPVAARMRYFDLSGRANTVELAGWPARIAQHENDHLDGRLIVDFLEGDDR